MLCSDDFSKLLSGLITCKSDKNSEKDAKNDDKCSFNLSPSDLLVIGGILADVISVESVLIDKDQRIEIVLSGSLKRKTELDEILDKIGTMSFDDVLTAILCRVK